MALWDFLYHLIARNPRIIILITPPRAVPITTLFLFFDSIDDDDVGSSTSFPLIKLSTSVKLAYSPIL